MNSNSKHTRTFGWIAVSIAVAGTALGVTTATASATTPHHQETVAQYDSTRDTDWGRPTEQDFCFEASDCGWVPPRSATAHGTDTDPDCTPRPGPHAWEPC
ncbi:hypothetical protein R3Q06_34520 [Rhodococcus erythropolis]|uniref:hypothetical protein n=1 Tax=Rhodococcus erythropolis TaxID=1833 RepID=UPI002948F2D8|nr:hypothetical protein [Rhodococcus erythropolis]MDV6278517.1 hypothetical protein [Rhodococcus erythropolis]